MGIIGDVKKFFSNAADTVKSVFTSKPKVQNTLNQQINNGTLVDEIPTQQVGDFSNLRNTFNVNQEKEESKPLNEIITDRVGQFGKKVLEDYQDVGEDVMTWLFSIPTKYSNYTYNAKRSTDSQREYNDNKSRVIKSYNPTNDSIGVLRADNDMLSQLYQDSFAGITDASSFADYQNAYEKFNQNVRDANIFEIKPEYRASRLYNQDTLDKLGANEIHYGNYTPTDEEIDAYLDTLRDNGDLQEKLSKKYITSDPNRTVLDLSDTVSPDISNFKTVSGEGIQEKARNVLNDVAAAKAVLYYNDFQDDQMNRINPILESIFRYEKEALAKPEWQRNDGDRYIIDTANIARKALNKYASNVNNRMNRILDEGVSKDGEITDALDTFRDGTTLQQVLTEGLGDIMGIDARESGFLGDHASPIDYFQALANDGIYKYKQANTDNIFRKGWNRIERAGEPFGDYLNEVGQVSYTLPIRVANLFSGKGWNPQSVAYFDMDASIGKLIETDDRMILGILPKRTVKKYALQLGEYAPEGITNIAPDILMIMYNAPGGITKTLTNVGRIGKFNRWKKGAATVEKLRKNISGVDKTLKGFDRIGAVGRERANVDSKNKRIWNIIDRGLTQFAIGQGMDAQLSVFDTEPYSDTSFRLSALGSLGFDLLSEFKDFYGIARTGMKGGAARMRSTGVWDLVDFIEQSDENAQAIARAMGKRRPTFTEQELRDYVSRYAEISDAATKVFNDLVGEKQAVAKDWTKQLMYNYVKQAYGANSNIGKAVRQILINKNTSPADIIKYIGRIPGDVQFGPYASTIKLKHGTTVGVSGKDGWYDIKLDRLDGGFDSRVANGFTNEDIARISAIEGYDDIAKNKGKLFEKLGDTYYLNDAGLDRFGLSKGSATIESLGLSIEQAENTREILKERMKDLTNKKIKDDTIDRLADSGGYDELVNKVKEILC